MARSLDRIASLAVVAAREAIADAGGNEVFLLGVLGEDRRVVEVRVAARGNRNAAPAILHLPRPGEVVIHNHPSGILEPSDADLEVASSLGQDGVGFFIVDNDVRQVYVVVEPHADREIAALDPEAVARCLGPGGAVAQSLPGYEHRPEQLAMLEAVVESFNGNGIATVEAGTGTGKSLAYLVPAIHWSLANRERVVVSTHTINLQEQLIRKDLPFLVERAGLPCKAVLVKGRGNYLCRRKAEQARGAAAQLIDDDLQRELRQVLEWAEHTRDGSRSDLPVMPRPEVWEQVVSENDNCLRARCPYYDSCFFYEARRAAAKADVLVVNHHLLMADLALREELGNYTQNAVLPPTTRVIIDEAHHLEDVATSYFGSRIGPLAIERTLGRLQQARNPTRGVLPALSMALESIESPEDAPQAQGAAAAIDERLLAQRGSLGRETQECFSALAAGLEDLLERPLGPVPEKVRVIPALRETPYWGQLSRAVSRLAASLTHYAESIARVLERIEQMSDKVPRQVRYLATELGAMGQRLAGCGGGLELFLGDDEESCRWIEGVRSSRGGPTLSFNVAPIAVGPLLRRALFERFRTVALTSATLAVEHRFDYLHERVGLRRLEPPERLRTLLVASPFDYERQALLAVPRDMPEPADPGFETASHEFMAELLALTRGGTFLLFTSYAALERAWRALQAPLEAMGLAPLRQGSANRSALLHRFTRNSRSVLFATDSFWEGVDVRGDALRCVVIAKLPFSVPTEPIQQARHEAIRAAGGSPFAEHTLPQAVLKLKQGFGRLIRSRDDRGAVVILDSRIGRRRYGPAFLESLPPARRVLAGRAETLAELRRFFAPPAAEVVPLADPLP